MLTFPVWKWMDGLDTTSSDQKIVTKKAERFIEQLWIGSLNVGIKIDCNHRLTLRLIRVLSVLLTPFNTVYTAI